MTIALQARTPGPQLEPLKMEERTANVRATDDVADTETEETQFVQHSGPQADDPER